MPNIHECLQRAVDASALDKQRALAAGSRYDQLVARYETIMPRHQAEATAAAQLKEATRRARRSRKHAVLNQLQTMARLQKVIGSSPDPALAIRNLLEHSEGSGYTGESVQSLMQAYVRSINAGLHDVLRATGRNMVGNSRDPATLRDVIRELHAEDTGSPRAKAMAQAVRDQQNRMRRLFNAHGGDIGELADFGINHSHDVAALRRAGFDGWRAQVEPLLDWGRIEDVTTGQPFAAGGGRPDPSSVARFLSEVYQGITSRGWSDRDPSMTTGGKALYNQRAEHRVLHFRDGSAWLDYNKQFGTSDPFSGMIGGLHAMARDVALMRVLGPNPKLGLEYARQVAERGASLRGDAAAEERIGKAASLAATMLAHIDGSVNVAESAAWGRFFSNTRQVLTSIQLGSAAMSAVTDVATMRTAAQVSGLNANSLVARSASLMARHATRETAARMGYVADTLADMGSTAARFTGDVVAGEFAERLSGFTMRASGLSYWTDMNRVAFQMEFAGFMADNADRAWPDIDAPLRRLFQERGITAADWDQLRDAATLFDTGDAKFLSPIHWLKSQTALPPVEAEGLALRLQMAIEEQMEFAVPAATVEGRARLVGSTAPGTFAGELMRSTAMYKNFAMSLTLGQIRRVWAMDGGRKAKALYAARLAASLTIMGALAIQLKELAKGRDPRPMDRPTFWGAAVFQGGGLGIFGDFFASETSRAGGGLAETLAGPVAGFASDVINPVASNVQRLAEGRAPLIGRDAANFVRYNTPVGSSLWYGRLAFDRLVADQMQQLLDPEAETLWRQQQRRRSRTYGNQTWWNAGELGPDRAPDLTTALGERP